MRKQSSGVPSQSNRQEEPQEFGDVSQYRELNAIGTGGLIKCYATSIYVVGFNYKYKISLRVSMIIGNKRKLY